MVLYQLSYRPVTSPRDGEREFAGPLGTTEAQKLSQLPRKFKDELPGRTLNA